MTVESPAVESTATPEVQAEATKLGWIPPDRFKGDPEKFVDADAYVERGHTLLPIVKATNKRLEMDVQRLANEGAATRIALEKANKALEEIEERHSVATQKAVENARVQLKRSLAVASEAGDHEAVAELTDQMTQLGKTEEKEKEKPVEKAAETYVPPQELVDWQRDNPWYGTDRRKTSLAVGIAQELRENGEKSVGREFFDKVGKEVELTLKGGKEEELPDSKVEGGRNGSDLESRQGGVKKKGYASLPADAKAACDADLRNFVGPTKKYKTDAEWRSRFASLYFEEK